MKIQGNHSGGRRQTNIGRLLAFVAITVSASTVARADDQPPAPIVKFVVAATPEPSPALRYRLLPPFLDLMPGNAALVYTKISVEFSAALSKEAHDAHEKVADWMDVPADQLPRAEVEEVLRWHDSRLAEADRAARMESCDWQSPVRGEKPWLLLLPEVQGMRHVARLLVLRIRLEVLDGKYDAAIRSLQTGLAMARHVAQQPTLISGLVGAAIANLTFNEVEALMRAPGAPNLYWALMALPQPLISLGPGMEQEQAFIDFAFPKLQNFDSVRYSPEQWREQLVGVTAVTKDLIGDPKQTPWPAEVLATALAAKSYPRARQMMIDAGQAADAVEKLPVAQVVLWGLITDYRRLRDESFKWYYVPYWQRGNGPQQAADAMRSAERKFEGYPFVNLIGAAQAASWAELRGHRLVAAHTAVEALRIHAAAHGGKLPAKLSDVTLAPVPLDPKTGQPFAYSLSGNTATITSDAPPGMSPEHFALHFEVTIIPSPASSAK